MAKQRCLLWKVISTIISKMFCLVRIRLHLWQCIYVWGSGKVRLWMEARDQCSASFFFDMILHWTMRIACHLPAAQQAPSICLSLSWSLIKCEGFRIWHHIVHLRKMCYLFSPKSVPHRGRGNHKSTLRKLLQDALFQS